MTRTLTAALGSLMLLVMPSASLAGSLTPPGPPAPTMKALEVVEPRTPITSLPFTIARSGSYYVTRNLSLASGDGITITVTDLSLDVNGFTLTGNAGGLAVRVNASCAASVRNGVFRSWGEGVHGDAGSTLVVSDVSTIGNYNGIVLYRSGEVRNALASGNTNYGIFVDNKVAIRNSQALANGGGIRRLRPGIRRRVRGRAGRVSPDRTTTISPREAVLFPETYGGASA